MLQGLWITHGALQNFNIRSGTFATKNIKADGLRIHRINRKGLADFGQTATVKNDLHVIAVIGLFEIGCDTHRNNRGCQELLDEVAAKHIVAVHLDEIARHGLRAPSSSSPDCLQPHRTD